MRFFNVGYENILSLLDTLGYVSSQYVPVHFVLFRFDQACDDALWYTMLTGRIRLVLFDSVRFVRMRSNSLRFISLCFVLYFHSVHVHFPGVSSQYFSFRFVLFCFASLRISTFFVSFRFVLFCFVSLRIITFRFVSHQYFSFRLISLRISTSRFVPFRFDLFRTIQRSTTHHSHLPSR